MRFIELFAGIGGFRYGLERCVGVESTNKESEQAELEVQLGGLRTPVEVRPGVLPTDNRWERAIYTCVYANEIDKYAASIYRKNFGGGELYEGDIRTVDTRDIPDHDLLVGGFPCQAFSIAGKRQGFNEVRGTLFFEIARILNDKRPRCVLLENVKGLLSHDSGKTFQTILKVLTDLGYRVEWQVLNSKDFGVPQNRERVFIVGHLRGQSGGQVFPNGESYKGTIQDRKKDKGQEHSGRAWALRQRDYKDGTNFIHYGNSQDQKLSDKVAQTLNAGHYNQPKIADGIRIRRLTPTECERLQGFPDGWTEGISDTQRYKCLGNAVTTNVITAIGKRIADMYAIDFGEETEMFT